MRDYSKVTATFWTGKTGKALKAHSPEALIVAMYLMTSPHSNMLGLFYQPMLYIAHETGLGLEGASKGLTGAIEAGFCGYDQDAEMVWVHEMAFFQIAAELKPSDNRCLGIQKEYLSLSQNCFLQEFFTKYSKAFCMTEARGLGGATKPRTGTGARTGARTGDTSPAKLPTCPHQSLIDLYHEVLPDLPAIRLMTDKRKKTISGFWAFVLTSKKADGTPRATSADEATAWVRQYFERARENDFLMGRSKRSAEHSGWECDLDFLLSDKGRIQVIEKTKDAT